MPAVAALDAGRQRESRQLAGDRDVRNDVEPSNAAERRKRRTGARKLGEADRRARELDLYVGVLPLDDESGEAAVLLARTKSNS